MRRDKSGNREPDHPKLDWLVLTLACSRRATRHDLRRSSASHFVTTQPHHELLKSSMAPAVTTSVSGHRMHFAHILNRVAL